MNSSTSNDPASAIRLIFVRHGIASHVEGRCIGQTNVQLSAMGAESIRELSFDNLHVAAIVSSDLDRAFESAKIVGSRLSLPVSTDARLREMNFGKWDGRAWNELEQSDGRRLTEWMEHWTHLAPPNGETVEELFTRVEDWLRDTIGPSAVHAQSEQHQLARGRTIVVVAHAGSIRAALCLLREIPAARMFDIQVEHAAPITVQWAVWPPEPHSA